MFSVFFFFEVTFRVCHIFSSWLFCGGKRFSVHSRHFRFPLWCLVPAFFQLFRDPMSNEGPELMYALSYGRYVLVCLFSLWVTGSFPLIKVNGELRTGIWRIAFLKFFSLSQSSLINPQKETHLQFFPSLTSFRCVTTRDLNPFETLRFSLVYVVFFPTPTFISFRFRYGRWIRFRPAGPRRRHGSFPPALLATLSVSRRQLELPFLTFPELFPIIFLAVSPNHIALPPPLRVLFSRKLCLFPST